MLADAFRSTEPKASRWYQITAEKVAAFADASEDWQGIHLEKGAAQAAGFDGPVAHGFFAVSMLSAMLYDVLPDLPPGAWSVNYGFDRIRFVAPVAVGSRIRGHFQISETQERENGVLLRWDVSVERDGEDKPAIVADWLNLVSWKEE
ncbi:MaoC/PaaZ C-terminal domain-containing protein [Roseivivax sp. THAF30]|uniref:MaoC/PaaZ C-terminal domain-containing protein n=1 Tax=Roseivivax sp. THAF30 TaxID=2587852 RepID=UPI0012682CBC|nr:MaoC/PaaZ C-terminal domain-containing protein [Roseivivax sp. THAF30]QFT64651.1 putative enoyl-CoA hydratase 1 [Roseivivax sp. THAF30]